MGERAKLVLEAIEGLSHIILRVTGYVMKLAPLAVFCAMAATIATNGLGILLNYAKFMGEFYFGLLCLWLLLVLVGFRDPRAQRQAPGAAGAGAVPAGVLHRQLRSSLSENAGATGEISDHLAISPASCCRWAIRSISTAR